MNSIRDPPALLPANGCIGMICAEQLLQRIELRLLFLNLLLLSLDLRLLFVEGVHKDGTVAIVFHAFDLSLFVVRDEQRIYLGHVLCAKADVPLAARFPIERNWLQLSNEA